MNKRAASRSLQIRATSGKVSGADTDLPKNVILRINPRGSPLTHTPLQKIPADPGASMWGMPRGASRTVGKKLSPNSTPGVHCTAPREMGWGLRMLLLAPPPPPSIHFSHCGWEDPNPSRPAPPLATPFPSLFPLPSPCPLLLFCTHSAVLPTSSSCNQIFPNFFPTRCSFLS